MGTPRRPIAGTRTRSHVWTLARLVHPRPTTVLGCRSEYEYGRENMKTARLRLSRGHMLVVRTACGG
eukprot:scaffold27676_cov126-Isochrysis_galbana.AAC.6